MGWTAWRPTVSAIYKERSRLRLISENTIDRDNYDTRANAINTSEKMMQLMIIRGFQLYFEKQYITTNNLKFIKY